MEASLKFRGVAGLVCGLALLAASSALAQGHPDSLRMSCEAARGLVSTRGSIVIGTGANLYDRFVATRAFCQPDEMTDPVWLPTADQRQCFIGYRCKRIDNEIER